MIKIKSAPFGIVDNFLHFLIYIGTTHYKRYNSKTYKIEEGITMERLFIDSEFQESIHYKKIVNVEI